jgi:hypothetical protein
LREVEKWSRSSTQFDKLTAGFESLRVIGIILTTISSEKNKTGFLLELIPVNSDTGMTF